MGAAGVGANLDRYARPLRSAESPFSNIDRVGCGKSERVAIPALQQIDGFAGVIPSQASMNDGIIRLRLPFAIKWSQSIALLCPGLARLGLSGNVNANPSGNA